MSRIGRDFNRTTPRSNITNTKINTIPSKLSVSLPQERLLPSSDAPQKVASPGPSNIERKTRYTKSNKVLNKTDPGSLVMAGMGNTISDYGGIVDGNYKDKSILNQSMGKALEGDWEGAGTLIRENPLRFAGNLLVEAGLAVVPVGAVLKVAKVGKVVNNVVDNVKKIVPKKTIDGEEVRTLYRVVGEGADKGMWFSKVPKDFYHDKVYAGVSKNMDGKLINNKAAQIRSVDVPASVYKQFRVANFMKTDMEPHKLSEFMVKHTPENSPSLPKEIIKQKNAELDKSIGGTLNSIGAYSPNNEWVLKHRWQKTEKVIATAGQKESFVKRLFNSNLSGDKYQNQITEIYKKKGYRSTSSTINGPERFSNISSFNKPFLRADDQIKLENKVPSALILTGANTAKTVASGASSNNKRVDDNAGLFGGYGQFLQ